MRTRQAYTFLRPANSAGRALRSTLPIASHLALWPGLYVVGAVACFAQIGRINTLMSWRAMVMVAAFALVTTIAAYLLDRVKLRDSLLDPADAVADPKRFAFVQRNATQLRVAIAVLLLTATWLGSQLSIWASVIPLLAGVGVFIYAGRPQRREMRPKDVLLLKNAYVAVGIAGFAGTISLLAIQVDVRGWLGRKEALAYLLPLGFSFMHLTIRVFADAVLCDLDDEEADCRFGTRTLPGRLGRTQSWNLAMSIRLCLAVMLAANPLLQFWPRMGWACVTVISSLTLRLFSPTRVQDWVDLRFPLEAFAVAVVLMILKGG